MQRLSRLIDTDWSNISSRARQDVRHAFADFFAVAIAGKDERPYRTLASYITETSTGNVPLIGFTHKISAKDGATVWGTLGHAIDYDDSSPIMVGHPSVVLIPPLIALGYEYKKNGAELFDAYLTGYEVIGRISARSANEQYRRGWHNTSTIGIIGATVGAAKLVGLNQNQTEHAIGISISLAGGIQANFGSMTKTLHPGIAAGNAVFAVEMAKKGFESSPDAMKAYFSLYGEQPFQSTDKFYIEDGITFKPYPACGCCTRAIDCILDITNQTAFSNDHIEKITCSISPLTNRVLQFTKPETVAEAKFSLEYSVAVALHDKSINLGHYDTNHKLKDEKVLKTMRLVERKVLDDLTSTSFADEYMEIEILMKDGSHFISKSKQPKGFPKNPMTPIEFKKKFMDCIGDNLNENTKENFFKTLSSLDQQGSFSNLMDEIVAI